MERTLARKICAGLFVVSGWLGAGSAIAQTPPCATVLTQSIRLDADMICPITQPALIVGAHNVRIELNGYRIVAVGSIVWLLFSTYAPAIHSSGWNGVEVLGPGVTMGWLREVRIIDGRNHRISGITGRSLAGIALEGISDSRVHDNDVGGGILIHSDPRPPAGAPAPAYRNEVFSNRLGNATYASGGVVVMGCLAAKNTVSQNEINGTVQLLGGAYQNLVEGNRIVNGPPSPARQAVYLTDAFANEVRDNQIDAYGETGIWIDPVANPQCHVGTPGMNGDDNRLIGNVIRNGMTGVEVSASYLPPFATLGTANLIQRNTFLDMSGRGLRFGAGSFKNDGRRNKYSNVAIEVEDFGTGNLWP